MTEDRQAARRLEQSLRDFLAFTAVGARLVARGRAAYDADEMLRLAAEAILHRLGEAVGRLDRGFTEAHPTVRWRQLEGVRNLVAHEYHLVDYAILWNVLETELPREAAAIAKILGEGRSA